MSAERGRGIAQAETLWKGQAKVGDSPFQLRSEGSVMITMRAEPLGNLPQELTSFVGRRRELAEVKSLLAASRLVTLVGVGGVGLLLYFKAGTYIGLPFST
jgi:hypothetical protein